MREKLNGNPMAQAGVVLVLLIAVGFFLLKGMGGGEEGEEAAPTEATVAVEGTGVTGTATGATPGEAVEGAIEAAGEQVSSSAATAVASSVPAPPLPRDVTSAYESGKTVVLLVVRDGGIDDELAKDAVEGVRSVPDTAVFVIPVHEIARYAAITLGVEVDRVPALVVLRPKNLSEAGPEASISYGLQTSQSVEQAVRDARYNGPTASYHPE
ncbi:MAG TPA: hypothetical protein VGO66_04185 [Solirubrobacterales bacterium]|jgi:hypothetical protein|nr:hypothetical protein [Solirubrobacterales bacterium]